MLLWLMACKQVWGLSQVNESHPCSVCFLAHILLKHERTLAARSGLTTFVLMNQSPWCPAACFQTPLDCSLGVGESTEGAAESNPVLTLEMLPSPLFSWLVHFPAPGNSLPISVALLPFACSLSNVLRSLCSYAVVRIRLIAICYTREEEFCFLI